MSERTLKSPKMESIKDFLPISMAGGMSAEFCGGGNGAKASIPVFYLHSCTLFLFCLMEIVGSRLNPISKAALKLRYAKSSSPESSGTPTKVLEFRLMMGWATRGTSMEISSAARVLSSSSSSKSLLSVCPVDWLTITTVGPGGLLALFFCHHCWMAPISPVEQPAYRFLSTIWH